MKQKILLLAALALLAMAVPPPRSELCLAKDIPPCSCVPLNYIGTNEPINIDTNFVFDTCGIDIRYISCDSTFYRHWVSKDFLDTKRKMRAKGPFWLFFDFPAIKLPKYPKDTLIILHWNDIDTVYQEVRAIFDSIEKRYGSFHFTKLYPFADTGRPSQNFRLEFDNWMTVSLAEALIEADIPNAYCEFRGYPDYGSSSVFDSYTDKLALSPNPATDFIYLNKGLQSLVPAGQIKIYNTFGECVMSLETGLRPVSTKIDVSGLPAGVYFVRCGGEIGRFVKI